jgi:hypothetical protein
MHHDPSAESTLDPTLDSTLDPTLDPTVDRRALLAALAASPLLLGANDLVTDQGQDGQAPRTTRPPWFAAAMQRARQRRVPLVGFVVPDCRVPEAPSAALRRQKAEFQTHLQTLCRGGAHPVAGGRGPIAKTALFTINFEDRPARFAVYLQILLDTSDTDLRGLFLDSVCVCAPAGLLGAEQSETVVILDPRGERTGGDIIDLADPKQVVSKLANLLHGGGKLRLRATATRTPAISAALADLTSSGASTRARARATLVEQMQLGSAVILHEYRTNDVLRRPLAEVINAAYQRAVAKDFDGLLPFGARLQTQMVYDPCPPCGMARVPAGTRKMLELLDK